MQIRVLALALFSVVLSASSQVAIKAGMTSAPIQAAIARSGPMQMLLAVSHSWLVLGGLFGFGLSAAVWLAVLSRAPLSAAYPVVALGFVITAAAGVLLFNEPLSLMKGLGVSLIVCGVVFVALSS